MYRQRAKERAGELGRGDFESMQDEKLIRGRGEKERWGGDVLAIATREREKKKKREIARVRE